MLSLVRRLLKVFHPEGIPWPGTTCYNVFSQTRIFQRHYAFIADDIQVLWDLLVAPRVNGKLLGVLSGHTHITYERFYKGIPVFGLRSTTFSFALQDEPLAVLEPPHYRLVSVQDGLLTTRIFEVNLS